MQERSRSQSPPSWAKAGNRWGPWLYWPMLCMSIGLLGWRIIDGDSATRVAVAACQVLLWGGLLLANRSARRRNHET